MKTILLAALLLAIPAASQTLDYRTLCGATEGTGDNNDFCTLWAQGNHQGMRNALSIAIRTARAAENRNRYYFDHKRGAERGAFIQLKRPWMGEEWEIRRRELTILSGEMDVRARTQSVAETYIELRNTAGPDLVYVTLRDAYIFGREHGYESVSVWWWDGGQVLYTRESRRGFSSDFVRRIVECKIDEYGWDIWEVDVRPDCEGIEE